MKETKKSIVDDIMECFKWISDNHKWREVSDRNIDYVLYKCDELTVRSLMKNKKEKLVAFRYHLLEEVIY